jgi:hypothetical protein
VFAHKRVAVWRLRCSLEFQVRRHSYSCG